MRKLRFRKYSSILSFIPNKKQPLDKIKPDHMKDFVLISNMKYSEVISLTDIVFIQADGSYSKVFLNSKKTISCSKNLSFFETVIKSDSFIRIHKSYLVNLDYLNKIFNNEDKISLVNNVEIPMSRYKKKLLWEKLNQ
jgi:two-component system LytT family response regulator